MGLYNQQYLVGGLEHWLLFFHTLGIIIPTDEIIFFRGVGIPPTSCLTGFFPTSYQGLPDLNCLQKLFFCKCFVITTVTALTSYKLDS